MTDDRVERRAELTAEEKAAGSDDPGAQAQEIIEESDERVAGGRATAASNTEHRTTEDTLEPPD